MPKLKKTAREKYLSCISENLRICCKIFGAEKIATIMCVSKSTVYSRIKSPSCLNADELFRLSEFVGTEPEDFTRPIFNLKGGDAG